MKRKEGQNTKAKKTYPHASNTMMYELKHVIHET